MAIVESRLEAKRSARWDRLTSDDLDHDGLPDVVMRDDGQAGDKSAGDGVYTGLWEQDGILLIWTLTPNEPGPLLRAGYVLVDARAFYGQEGRRQVVEATTVRANPSYVGP